MEKHDRFFQKQLKFRFDEKRKSKQKTAAGEGRSLRSHVDIDFENNDDAYEVRTSNFKELSRYVLEDILGCRDKGGRPMLLCIAKELDKRYAQFPSEASEQQSLMGIGGDVRIGGKLYHQIKVVVEHARAHDDLASGLMQRNKFYHKFEVNEGFVVRAVDTERGDAPGQPILFTFSWKDLTYI